MNWVKARKENSAKLKHSGKPHRFKNFELSFKNANQSVFIGDYDYLCQQIAKCS